MKFFSIAAGMMLAINGLCGPVYTELNGLDVHDEMSKVQVVPNNNITCKISGLKKNGKEYKGNIVFDYKNTSPENGKRLLALTFSSSGSKDIQVKMFLKWYCENSLRRDRNTLEFAGQGARTVLVPFPDDMKTKVKRINFQLKMSKECELKETAVVNSAYSVKVANDPLEAVEKLVIKGDVPKNATTVQVCLKDANGKLHKQTVKCINAGYELEWIKPPLSSEKWNSIYVETEVDGKNVLSLPVGVFGYKTNEDYAWLKVKGKDIITSAKSLGGEKKFIATGVGYAKDVIMAAGDEDVVKFCKSQHLNTVRMPFYTNLFNNQTGKHIDIDEHIKYFIDPIVKAAKRNDMYVILDAHEYFHKNIDESRARGEQANMSTWSEKKIQKWITNWTIVAEYYKNEPNILAYELLNEPHSLPPEFVRNLYGRCLKAIREVDQRHIIILGNNDWTHSRAMEKTWGDSASKFDAPYNNIVFAFHDYPKDNDPWLVKKYVMDFRDKHNVPVMCTEFGATHWNKSETVCREFMTGMFTLFAQEDIGWMIWALKRLENNPRSPYNKVDKTGLGPPPKYDSCPYSDMWPIVARMMGSKFPQPTKK